MKNNLKEKPTLSLQIHKYKYVNMFIFSTVIQHKMWNLLVHVHFEYVPVLYHFIVYYIILFYIIKQNVLHKMLLFGHITPYAIMGKTND